MIQLKVQYIIVSILIFLFAGLNWGIADGKINFNKEGLIEPTVRSQSVLSINSPERNIQLDSYSIETTPVTYQFPYILLSTSVFDNENKPVTDLTEKDFLIQERVGGNSEFNTVPIACFSNSVTTNGISFALVVDISASMEGKKLADVKNAVADFIHNAHPNDKGALVSFSTGGTEKIVSSLNWVHSDINTNGIPDITDAVSRLNVEGDTAIFDATAEGMDSLVDAATSKIVILFSDGATNSDIKYDINTVVERAKNENIVIYTIGIGMDSDNLKDLASATGGEYHFAPTSGDMGEIYTNIYNDFSEFVLKRYNLWYQTDSTFIDGSKHEFSITCKGASNTGAYYANKKIEITMDEALKNFKLGSDPTDKEFTLSGEIKDTGAGFLKQELSATLFYRWDTADGYTQLTLPLAEEEEKGCFSFQITIPVSMNEGKGFQYYIKAFDDNRESFSPFNYTVLPHYIPNISDKDIEINHTQVTHVDENQPITLNASITESGDSVDMVLYYRCHEPNRESRFFRSTMSTNDGLNYTVFIPADHITPAGIDYFIVASSWNFPVSFVGTSSEPNFITVGDSDYHYPVANAGSDQKSIEGKRVFLDGSDSFDEDPEDTISYIWQQIGGKIVVLSDELTAQPSFIAPPHFGESVLTFSLMVVDEKCQQSTDMVNITITDEEPVAKFSYLQDEPVAGTPISFIDQSSSSVDSIVSWVWDFGGEAISHEQNPSFTFEEPGVYPVSITITDSDGSISTTSEMIIVAPADYNPTSADAGSDQVVTEEDLVQLDGTNSTSTATGGALTYHWEQLEGTVVELSDPNSGTPTFTAPPVDEDGATLTFMLTVTDATGVESQSTVRITVNDSICMDCDENAGCFITVSSSGMKRKGDSFLSLFFLFVFFATLFFLNKRYPICSSKIISWFAVFLFLCPLNGYAEISSNTISISPLVGRYVFDKDQDIDHDFTGGIGIDYNFDEHWGTEAIFHYGRFKYNYFDTISNQCAEDDLEKYSVYLNGLYHLWPDSSLTPFFTAGIGYITLDFDHFKTYSSGLINYGGGLKYSITDRIALRADIRHIFCFDESYNNLSCLLGVTFRFGSREKNVEPVPPIVKEESEIPAVAVTPVPPPIIAAVAKPPLPKKVPIPSNLLFGIDNANIKDIYSTEILDIGNTLKEDDKLIAIVEGHTCDLGPESYNLKLSEKRANAVKAAIIKTSGIAPERVVIKPMGETSPVVKNNSLVNREKNRRVVIKYMQAEDYIEPVTAD